jgi:hypothetical protein
VLPEPGCTSERLAGFEAQTVPNTFPAFAAGGIPPCRPKRKDPVLTMVTNYFSVGTLSPVFTLLKYQLVLAFGISSFVLMTSRGYFSKRITHLK